MSLLRRSNRGSTFLKIFMVCYLGWWLITFGGAAAAGPKAKIYLPEISYDFGEVYEDQPLTHTFEVKNNGEAPLVIERLEPDCACTLTDYQRRIAPGEVGKITLTIEPYSVIRQFCKRTEIVSNDPKRPVAVLELFGYAKPFIEIKPRHIIRFLGNPEEPHTAQVQLISNLLTPLQLTGYKTDIADKIDVSIEPLNPGKIFVVKVSNKFRQIGKYKGKIIINTNSEKRPQLILRVFADLYPPSAMNP